MSDREPLDYMWRNGDESRDELQEVEEQLVSEAEFGDRLREENYAHL